MITRILLEILDNAIHYTKKSSTVTVTISPHAQGLLIEVQDAGIGIMEEQQALVFTKFFRGSNVDKDVAGAGLGLYIAREYSKLLGGKIWFKSSVGKGTLFSVLLTDTK